MPLALLFVDDLRCHALERGTAFVDGFEEPPQELGIHRLTRLVPLAGSSAGSYRGSTAALGGRAATAGFGVKPRENEEGRGGKPPRAATPKVRQGFRRAALAGPSWPAWLDASRNPVQRTGWPDCAACVRCYRIRHSHPWGPKISPFGRGG